MKNIRLITHMIGLITSVFFLMTAVGCSSDNTVPTDPDDDAEDPVVEEKFFIAAKQDDSGYFLTVDELASGTVSIVGNGLEISTSFTHLVSGTHNLITALAYRQGDPGIGVSFRLDENGELEQVAGEFQLTSGYNTVGIFENYIVAGRTSTLASTDAPGAAFYFVDQTTGKVSQKEFDSRVLMDGIEAPNFAGILDRGNGEFLSAYTKEASNVDSVWVAAFDKDFNLKRVYKDDRISYAAGRFRSARYQQIENDDQGNTYVFSGAYESETTKPAGAIRIPKDATDFDDYYFNIEEKSNGHHFRKVWHAEGDNFLMEFYNDAGAISNQSAATQYGIVNVTTKEVKFIEGIPSKEEITETGWPIAYDGKLYLPLTADQGYPTVYVIDPTTATAEPGLVIEAGGILGLGVFNY